MERKAFDIRGNLPSRRRKGGNAAFFMPSPYSHFVFVFVIEHLCRGIDRLDLERDSMLGQCGALCIAENDRVGLCPCGAGADAFKGGQVLGLRFRIFDERFMASWIDASKFSQGSAWIHALNLDACAELVIETLAAAVGRGFDGLLNRGALADGFEEGSAPAQGIGDGRFGADVANGFGHGCIGRVIEHFSHVHGDGSARVHAGA